MTDLERVLVAVASDLDRIGRRYALVGGLAVAVRAEPRLTRDVDLAVSVASDHEAEAVLRALIGTGHRVVATVEHDVTGRLAAARLTREEPAVGVVCDLLFASSGIEPEIVSGAEPIEVLAGLVLPVASVGHLIARSCWPATTGSDRPTPTTSGSSRPSPARTTGPWRPPRPKRSPRGATTAGATCRWR